jgi:hypothetical protein
VPSNITFLSLAAALLAPALVQAGNAELYGQVGTEGFGAGVAYHLSGRHAVRLEANAGSVSRDVDAAENTYDVEVDAESYGIFYDFRPWPERAFRLSLGVASLQTQGRGDVTGNAVVIDGVAYPRGPDDDLWLTVRPERSAAPYLGVGWGRSLGRAGNLGVFADLGVFFTSYEARLRASQSLVDQVDAALTAAGSTDTAAQLIEQEEAEAQDEVDDYSFYPVLKIGLTYRF